MSYSEDPTVKNVQLNYTVHVLLNDTNPYPSFSQLNHKNKKNFNLEEKLRFLLCIKNAYWGIEKGSKKLCNAGK